MQVARGQIKKLGPEEGGDENSQKSDLDHFGPSGYGVEKYTWKVENHRRKLLPKSYKIHRCIHTPKEKENLLKIPPSDTNVGAVPEI